MSRLRPRVIARLDIKGDMLVKGRQFEGIRPIISLADFLDLADFSSIDELFLLDVTSSYFGVKNSLEQISQSVSITNLPVTFEGGVRTMEDAIAIFDAGAERVSLNSILYTDSSLAKHISDRYGMQAVVASITTRPIKSEWRTMKHSGREPGADSLKSWWEQLQALPIGEYIISSILKDGMLGGPDYELLQLVKEIGVERFIYSGGVPSTEEGLKITKSFGARGFTISRAFVEQTLSRSS